MPTSGGSNNSNSSGGGVGNRHNNGGLASSSSSSSSRFNLLAPSRTNPAMGKPGNSDQSMQRYLLTEPEGVFPLPSQSNGSKLSSCCFKVSMLTMADVEIYPDFDPWQKNKQEDALAVEYIQKGYYERQWLNENSSARVTMLSLLKQWTSLPALSFFLLNSMDSRDKACRISSASTFKPPPRVTLTDQKKEAWLRDLATPSVPLRKLSRTIPHGIRNRTLLEQCCLKAIPISRAVWFARCVGANELRGLKRKGNTGSHTAMAAEVGWIRDWSEDVVTFIEKIVREFDVSKDAKASTTTTMATWKFKIEYITRLLAHLFHEDLLDRQLVLKWSLRFLQNSKPEELAVTLVYVKMFWSYLSSSRVLSQSLARALLSQYSALSSTKYLSPELFSPLLMKVSECIKELFLSSPDSFVIPEYWRSLGPVLSEAIKTDFPLIEESLQMIRVRNESLIVSDAPIVRSQRNQRARFVKELDSLKAPFNFYAFSKAVRALGLKEDECLQILFNWATFVNRAHQDKVYLCLSLCQFWRDEYNWDISASFQYFLVHIHDFSLYSRKELFDLTSEFLENDLLLLESYFRGLISSGLLFVKRLRQASDGHLALLTNLPMSRYPVEFRNQQAMLLRGLGCSDNQEYTTFAQAKSLIENRLAFLFEGSSLGSDYDTSDLTAEEVEILDNLTKGSKVELCDLLLDEFETKLNNSSSAGSLNYFQFGLVQRVLTVLRGPRTLYTMIEMLLPKITSATFLYILANTIRDDLEVFSTFGDIPELIQLLVTQYKSLKVRPRMSKGFVDLLSLTMDAVKPDLRVELEQMLKPSTNPSPMDVSKLSPVSESIASDGTITAGNSGECDEVDELLLAKIGITNNVQIDSRSIQNYFEPASSMFLDACKKNGDEIRQLIKVLQHLREADVYVFTDVLVKWLRDQVEPELQQNSCVFLKVLVFLVIYECITIDKIADIFMQLKSVKSPDSPVHPTKVMLDLIASNDLRAFKLRALEETSLDFQRNLFRGTHCKIFLKYIFQGLVESTETTLPVHDWYNGSVGRFLIWLSNHDTNMLINVIVDPVLESKDRKAIDALSNMLRGLIGTPELSDDLSKDPVSMILQLLKSVTVYNLSLCQIQMRVLLQSMHPQALENTSDNEFYSEKEIISSLLKSASKAEYEGISNETVGDMMIFLPKTLKGQLLQSVELSFLQSDTFPKVKVGSEDGAENSVGVLFEIVDAIADSATEDITANTTLDVHKNLSQLISLSEECPDEEDSDDDEIECKMQVDNNNGYTSKDVKDGIKLFVKIIMIQCQTFPPEAKIRERLVQGLLSLLETPLAAGASEMNGLLIDTLNAIRGELSDVSSHPTGQTPSHGRKMVSTPSQHDPKQAVSSNAGQMLASATACNEIKTKDDTSYLSDLMIYDKTTHSYKDLSLRSFDLLEDPNPTMSINDVPLNLSMFDSSIIENNPP
jgi:mediator of RNA polymerase II transcription subunit 12